MTGASRWRRTTYPTGGAWLKANQKRRLSVTGLGYLPATAENPNAPDPAGGRRLVPATDVPETLPRERLRLRRGRRRGGSPDRSAGRTLRSRGPRGGGPP